MHKMMLLVMHTLYDGGQRFVVCLQSRTEKTVTEYYEIPVFFELGNLMAEFI